MNDTRDNQASDNLDLAEIAAQEEPVDPHHPKTQFTDDQAQAILAHARDAVDAAVRQQPLAASLPPDLHHAPAFGIFVTLRRPTLLRACRGRWGQPVQPLGPLLRNVAHDTATLDPRFPSITPEELPLLGIDVSLMFDPAPVLASGEDRIAAIDVGTHGLVIDHPRGRGLLLPNVATEHNWDAKTFLDHLSIKAGLPPDTWRRDPAAKLMTFQTRLFAHEPPQQELNPHHLRSDQLHQLVETINHALRNQPINSPQLAPALTQPYPHQLGLCVRTDSSSTAAAFGANRSLLDLALNCTRSLIDTAVARRTEPEPVKQLFLLWQPVRLAPADYPSRHAHLASAAVLVQHESRWQLSLPDRPTDFDRVGQALRSMQMTIDHWHQHAQRGAASLTAFSVTNFESPQRPGGPSVRQPARAGQFYPALPDDMNAVIDAHMAVGTASLDGVTPAPARAVMLPHAGWVFCGDVIGKTLARVRVPQTVIVIGPKHTPFGSTWSVPPHQRWNVPGSTVPIATDLIEKLIEHVPELDCEPEAHKLEHACEVLLPFLLRLRPDLRVLPIVMGNTSYEATTLMASALATLIAGLDPAPLLVISSDMNHFADDAQNRRLDRLALDAMLTADPRKLYDTCEDHQISMCGLLPAVTVMQALAKEKPVSLQLVDYTTSAAVTGDTSRVVGYVGVVIN